MSRSMDNWCQVIPWLYELKSTSLSFCAPWAEVSVIVCIVSMAGLGLSSNGCLAFLKSFCHDLLIHVLEKHPSDEL